MPTTYSDLDTQIRRLPARLIHALGMDRASAEEKLAFAEEVNELVDERLYEKIWAGVNNEILDALQTEYELDPEVEAEEILKLVIEMQPDLTEKMELALEELFAELTENEANISTDTYQSTLV